MATAILLSAAVLLPASPQPPTPIAGPDFEASQPYPSIERTAVAIPDSENQPKIDIATLAQPSGDVPEDSYQYTADARAMVSSRGGMRLPQSTSVPTATSSPTPTTTPTHTATPTGTPTAKPTSTPTPTEAPTNTPKPTQPPTNTPAPTQPPTSTPVPTDTPTPKAEATSTPAPTETSGPSGEAVPPSGTPAAGTVASSAQIGAPSPSAEAAPAPAPCPTPASPPPDESTQIAGEEIAAIAQKYAGFRYAWGGSSPNVGFDCSGFIGYVYHEAGVPIPNHDLGGQLHSGPSIDPDKLQPGDLVFFQNTYTSGLSHGGIYIGGGQFIHAVEEGVGVKITSMDEGYWSSRFVGASRPWAQDDR